MLYLEAPRGSIASDALPSSTYSPERRNSVAIKNTILAVLHNCCKRPLAQWVALRPPWMIHDLRHPLNWASKYVSVITQSSRTVCSYQPFTIFRSIIAPSPLWNPSSLLNIIPPNASYMTGIGSAVSKGGLRCRWRISNENFSKVCSILNTMERKSPNGTIDMLPCLAKLSLCAGYHRSHKQ